MDLAGGTLDIWPIGLLHPEARTVNVAIDLAARVELSARAAGYRLEQGTESVEASTAAELAARPEGALLGVIVAELDLPPVDIRIRSDSPRGAGLGASSALAMAAIAAGEMWLGRPASGWQAASALGRDLEARLMGLPTGKQDQLAALFGGALEIRHAPGGVRVRRLEVDLERLGDSLIVAYSGQTHFSAGNNWQVVKRRLDGESEVVAAFEGIAAAAAEIGSALEAGNLPEVGRLMSSEWGHRRRLAPEVSTPRVDALIDAAMSAGSWGAKVCGAGGGGCLAILAAPDRRQAVTESLSRAGAQVLATRPVATPLEVRSLDA